MFTWHEWVDFRTVQLSLPAVVNSAISHNENQALIHKDLATITIQYCTINAWLTF